MQDRIWTLYSHSGLYKQQNIDNLIERKPEGHQYSIDTIDTVDTIDTIVDIENNIMTWSWKDVVPIRESDTFLCSSGGCHDATVIAVRRTHNALSWSRILEEHN